MPILTDDERDRLILVLVAQAQATAKPFGHDAARCVVCGARIARYYSETHGMAEAEPHTPDCAFHNGLTRLAAKV